MSKNNMQTQQTTLWSTRLSSKVPTTPMNDSQRTGTYTTTIRSMYLPQREHHDHGLRRRSTTDKSKSKVFYDDLTSNYSRSTSPSYNEINYWYFLDDKWSTTTTTLL
eukprot:533938-Amphidinium_carterae.2